VSLKITGRCYAAGGVDDSEFRVGFM
jgi:hypothetical protein